LTRAVLVAILLTVFASAQDGQLDALRRTLLALREGAEENRDTRGATGALTTAKHQMRDWIESRLTRYPAQGDVRALWDDLHAGLRDAQLFCDDENQCYPSNLGWVDEIQVSREGPFLAVLTAAGIWCGYDYSAYLYEYRGTRWNRVWANEQTNYTKDQYLPQILHTLRISEPDQDGTRLLMTLGSRPACGGAWQPLYYRIWRIDSRSKTAVAVLDRSELAGVDGDPPAKTRLNLLEAWVEFSAGGTGYGSPHKAVRRFEIRGSRAIQTDPIAVTPRDFVEEWLSLPWSSSGARSENASLKAWYDKLHRTDGQGDFPDAPLRCAGGPNLWVVGTHLHEAPKYYYRVRWTPPYKFTMVGVSERPYPDCQ
jgi:hypothetical protein